MVKKIIWMFFISSGTLMAQGQIEIPLEVKIQFMEDFISASTVAWVPDGSGNYKADFVHQSEFKSVSYSKEGAWLYTETRLFPAQVPASVLESLSSAYKSYDIEQVKKLEMKQGISFQFKIRIKNSVYDIEIDSSGKIKSKRKVYEIEDEDEENKKGDDGKRKKKEKHKKHKHEKN